MDFDGSTSFELRTAGGAEILWVYPVECERGAGMVRTGRRRRFRTYCGVSGGQLLYAAAYGVSAGLLLEGGHGADEPAEVCPLCLLFSADDVRPCEPV